MSMDDLELRDIVLIVDDSPETLSFLTEAFEVNGMAGLVARSGSSALSLIERVSPDAILMDAVMPEMDGFETCRRIKEKREFLHVPVIFMTGLSETEHVLKGFQAGGVDYVTKPVDPDEILARVRAHIGNARLAQSARIALDLAGSTIIAANAKGDLIWTTPKALAHLQRAFESYPPKPEIWLRTMAPGLIDLIAEATAGGAISRTLGGLTLSYLGEGTPGEYLFGLSDGATLKDNEILRRRLNLTERETEVLLWIAQGKSNRDISAILKCSPRTINKHLEQIFTKLGVENRTAAATLAVRILFSR